MSLDGFELEHVHFIVVNVGDEQTQFNMDKMLKNLSSTNEVELVELLWTKYSLWATIDIEQENLNWWLNQILITLMHYMA